MLSIDEQRNSELSKVAETIIQSLSGLTYNEITKVLQEAKSAFRSTPIKVSPLVRDHPTG